MTPEEEPVTPQIPLEKKRGNGGDMLVSYLVRILSPVNHKGLHHGQKQCSICFLFTLHASRQTTNYPQTTESVLTQTNIKQKIHKHQTQNFQRISPFDNAIVNEAKTFARKIKNITHTVNTKIFLKKHSLGHGLSLSVCQRVPSWSLSH